MFGQQVVHIQVKVLIKLGSDYYFLKFSVTTCVNDSYSNFSWKPKCKTQDEMFTQLKAQGSFRFQLFTTNFVFKYTN